MYASAVLCAFSRAMRFKKVNCREIEQWRQTCDTRSSQNRSRSSLHSKYALQNRLSEILVSNFDQEGGAALTTLSNAPCPSNTMSRPTYRDPTDVGGACWFMECRKQECRSNLNLLLTIQNTNMELPTMLYSSLEAQLCSPLCCV